MEGDIFKFKGGNFRLRTEFSLRSLENQPLWTSITYNRFLNLSLLEASKALVLQLSIKKKPLLDFQF